MKLINIGFGSMISAARLIAVVSPDSAPVKRIIQEAKDRGMLIDASYGHKTKSVLLMDTDHVILSALTPETIGARWGRMYRKRRMLNEQRKIVCDFRRVRRGKKHGAGQGHGSTWGSAVFCVRNDPCPETR